MELAKLDSTGRESTPILPPKNDSELDTRVRSISTPRFEIDHDYRRCRQRWVTFLIIVDLVTMAVCIPLFIMGNDSRKEKVFYIALGVTVATVVLFGCGKRSTSIVRVDSNASISDSSSSEA
jgi:hypothetical protein